MFMLGKCSLRCVDTFHEEIMIGSASRFGSSCSPWLELVGFICLFLPILDNFDFQSFILDPGRAQRRHPLQCPFLKRLTFPSSPLVPMSMSAGPLAVRHDICQNFYATDVFGATNLRKKRVHRDYSKYTKKWGNALDDIICNILRNHYTNITFTLLRNM